MNATHRASLHLACSRKQTLRAAANPAKGVRSTIRRSDLPKWLSASVAEVSVGADGASRVQIQANPATLRPGVYSGAVTISSAKPPQKVLVPVTMTVPGPPAVILPPHANAVVVAAGGPRPAACLTAGRKNGKRETVAKKLGFLVSSPRLHGGGCRFLRARVV